MAHKMLLAALFIVLSGPVAAQDEKPAVREDAAAGETKSVFVNEEFPWDGEVTVERLNVRLFPKPDSPLSIVAAVLPQGEKLTVVAETVIDKVAYFQVVAPRGTAVWIFARNVKREADDWGAVIGFYRARRYPEQIKAVAHMEAIVLPRRWEDFPNGVDKLFRALRSPEGERLVLDENVFVEVVLPRGMLRKLSDEEMEAYRAPYRDRERRLPTLVWPRELPIDGVPEDVVAIVEKNAQWLRASTGLPKLFINGDPGAIVRGRVREFCRTLPNQREVTVKGLHHLQEDAPREIGEALREFVLGLRA